MAPTWSYDASICTWRRGTAIFSPIRKTLLGATKSVAHPSANRTSSILSTYQCFPPMLMCASPVETTPLRRGYSFTDGMGTQTGELDAGLFFIAFQRDPRTQFVPLQQRLASDDALNEYITHVCSTIFACPPGVRSGGFVGETLFNL